MKKKEKNKTNIFIGSIVLLFLSALVIPPIIQKYSTRLYKLNLQKEQDNIYQNINNKEKA